MTFLKEFGLLFSSLRVQLPPRQYQASSYSLCSQDDRKLVCIERDYHQRFRTWIDLALDRI